MNGGKPTSTLPIALAVDWSLPRTNLVRSDVSAKKALDFIYLYQKDGFSFSNEDTIIEGLGCTKT